MDQLFFFFKYISKFCFTYQSICLSFQIENIAGKLVFYQMDGNATYVRDTGELASDVLTETTFELHDPQKNFTNTKFTYTWDLGNGYVKPHIYSLWTEERLVHACMMWFLMQRSDLGDRAGCPLPLLCIRELHSEAESWGQRDRIFTFTQWRLLQEHQSAGFVIRFSFYFSICSLAELCLMAKCNTSKKKKHF